MQPPRRHTQAPQPLRRVLAHVVLALLFVLAQHHAGKHWLAHALDSLQHHEAGAPAPSPCGDCNSVAAFGAALPTPEVAPLAALDLAHDRAVAAATAWLMAANAAVYRSRAPPARA